MKFSTSKQQQTHPLVLNFLKWFQTIKVSWSYFLTYRFNFFLQVIGPAIIFFFIKYNLWTSIYQGDDELIIQGYTLEQMISYHAWSLIVSLLAQGHSANNLSEDIRMGRISTYLIYPFNFWEYHTANFVAFQLLQLLISLFTLSILIGFSIISPPSFLVLFSGLLICSWIGIFWYLLQYLTGVLGFWLEETWILRVTLQMITAFLSGAILPLELYPSWIVSVLDYTPFPYLTYYPIKVFSGELEHLFSAFFVLGIWGILIAIVNALVWKKGLKLYTAAGI